MLVVSLSLGAIRDGVPRFSIGCSYRSDPSAGLGFRSCSAWAVSVMTAYKRCPSVRVREALNR